MAIHFLGGGEPLLLSVSEDAFDRLHRDLQGDTAFVIVQSLTNETVAIRSKAIADVYFSSEAYDDFDPEREHYQRFTGKQIVDPRDWQIIAALAHDGVGLEDFEEEDVERVRGWVTITDKQFEALVADRSIEPGELEAERAKVRDLTARLFAIATETVWQFSTGVQRREVVVEQAALYTAFYALTDFGGDHPKGEMLCLASEGRHRIIFINPSAIDYVSIPTHSFEEGHSLVAADELDEVEATEAQLATIRNFRPAEGEISAKPRRPPARQPAGPTWRERACGASIATARGLRPPPRRPDRAPWDQARGRSRPGSRPAR